MKDQYNFIPSFLSICYYISWAVIFIIYTNNDISTECKVLIQWDRALIIVLLFISAINLFTALINFAFAFPSRNILICSGISVCKSLLNYIAGIWLMIGIISAYCSMKPVSYDSNHNEHCKALKKANLAYIIIEMAIIGNCCLFVFAMCIIGQYRKYKRYRLEQHNETDIVDEESDI